MLAGGLIAALGAVDVLALDAALFFFFACLRGVADRRRALEPEGLPYSIREAVRFTKGSAAITLTTVMLASFNIGLGALLVVQRPSAHPDSSHWLTRLSQPRTPQTGQPHLRGIDPVPLTLMLPVVRGVHETILS